MGLIKGILGKVFGNDDLKNLTVYCNNEQCQSVVLPSGTGGSIKTKQLMLFNRISRVNRWIAYYRCPVCEREKVFRRVLLSTEGVQEEHNSYVGAGSIKIPCQTPQCNLNLMQCLVSKADNAKYTCTICGSKAEVSISKLFGYAYGDPEIKHTPPKKK